jgi:penicillin-binding protein 1A
MKTLVISFLTFLLLGALSLALVLRVGGRDLPSPAHLQVITPATKTRVFDKDGRLIGEFFRENRSLVRLDEIPEHLVQAFIAVEDRDFWDHWGVDLTGVARAAVKNATSLSVSQGASTITQQLARNLFLTHERSVERKMKEAVLALRIEQNYSKEEILEMYLNQIYFGDGAYGVQSAARRFFGKDVTDLTVGESALLAGLPKNPRDYSPRRHLDAALRRRAIVLASMEACEFISPVERITAAAESVQVTGAPLSPDNAPYFMEMVRQFLEREYGSAAIYEGGLTVYTTLDLPLQREIERALEEQLTGLEKRSKAKATRIEYVTAREQGENPPLNYLQGAAIVVDAQTGAIRGLTGGRSFEESKFNRAVSARRQPGSAFKPFVYLAAIQRGFYPSYTLLDAEVVYEDPGQDDYVPRNYDRDFRGQVTMREALNRSLNVPTIRLQEEIQIGSVIDAARATGIRSPLPRVRSIALGSAEVTLEELTYAYGVFANDGIRVEPMFITRIEDRSGNVIREFKAQRREALPAAPVAVLNDMLQSAINYGTGASARQMGFGLPAAGKTGTTDDYADAWFVGYTPEVVTGVWVGYDQRVPIGDGMSGSRAALPLWTKIMIAATQDTEPKEFVLPDGVVTREVCSESNYLALPSCPERKEEVFLRGQVPSQRCFLHGDTFDIRMPDRWSSGSGGN